jgi:hypothetical protein
VGDEASRIGQFVSRRKAVVQGLRKVLTVQDVIGARNASSGER